MQFIAAQFYVSVPPLGCSNLTFFARSDPVKLSLLSFTKNSATTFGSILLFVSGKFLHFLEWFRNTRFGRKFLDIAYDTAILMSYLAAFALIHKLQEKWLGGDYLVFGKYKIEYIIHVGHLMALALFFLEIVKTGIEVVRDIIQVMLGVVTDFRVAVQGNDQSH